MPSLLRALAPVALTTLASTACHAVGPRLGDAAPPGPDEPAPGPGDVDPGQETPTEEGWWDRLLRDLHLSSGSAVPLPSPETRDRGKALLGTSGPTSEDPDLDGNWLVAPVPFIDPTIGAGLALGAAYLVPFDAASPASTVGGGVLASENGSLGAALGFSGHFDEDRHRFTVGALATRLEFDLDVNGREVPLSERVVGLAVEYLGRVGPSLYLGPQVLVVGIDTRLARESDQGSLPDDQLDTTNVALGLRAQRDSRDSNFYPRSGSLVDLQVRRFDEALGSPFDYTVVPVAGNLYHSLDAETVLAMRVCGRFTSGDVPFYGQSYFGTGGDLRGYPVGRYYDDVLLAAQAELRRELVGSLGGVLFAGLGTVAPDLGSLDDGPSLPSLGFGLRYTLEDENHVNFRVDVAWGRDEQVLYLGVGEAF